MVTVVRALNARCAQENGKHDKPPDVRLFSFIDLPDVLTKTKRRHIMSKEEKQLSKKK